MPSNKEADALTTARQLNRIGDLSGAIAALKPLIKKRRRDTDLLQFAASLHMQAGQLERASAIYRDLIQIDPTIQAVHNNLASIYKTQGRFQDAARVLTNALKRFPRESRLAGSLCETHMRLGDDEAARLVIEPFGADHSPDPYVAIARARLCLRSGALEDGIAIVCAALDASDDLPRNTRLPLTYCMGDLCDRLGRFDDAFDAYRRANEIDARPFEPQAHADALDRVITTWTADTLTSLTSAGSSSTVPVFILGMPRSGTSLVEQILDRHPQFAGGGEMASLQDALREYNAGRPHFPYLDAIEPLTQTFIARHAADTLRRFRRVSSRASYVSDKTPHNFLHLPLIALLFPKARVIHCRRDPLDTCLSCYFQNLGAGNEMTGDLDHLASYFNAYTRLTNHYASVLPIATLDVHYEQLVADTEPQVRRMLDFLGLDFHDDCLTFHESTRVTATASVDQVRRPIYSSSVARWKHYEKHIAPLINGIGPASSS